VLLASMEAHCSPFMLHVLAWDWDRTSDFGRAKVTTRAQFLERHPDYASARLPGGPRRVIDEVVTARWRFVCDVMAEVEAPVTMIDGDIWFWSSPAAYFAEVKGKPFAVTPHRFAPAAAGLPGVRMETHRQYGAFNSGFTYFSDMNAAERMAALNYEWSSTGFLRLPSGREIFGDQGWLEMLVDELGGHVVQHAGVNVGPWNVHGRDVYTGDGGQLMYGEWPLVAYHYSSFRLGEQAANPEYQITAQQESLLYTPYRAIVELMR
jgi:hypothetical protein